jgi:hypothetical protein
MTIQPQPAWARLSFNFNKRHFHSPDANPVSRKIWQNFESPVQLFEKISTRRGAWAWFHDVWTCGAKVLEYWMISSLKTKLNRSKKSWRNWNVPLVFLERPWWATFNEIYLVRFGFRMWEILICKWFLPLKIQINSKKLGSQRKNQLRMW